MSEPVTLDDIKVHLRLEPGVTDEDVYLQTLIVGARRWVELHTKRVIVGASPTLVGDDLIMATHAIRLLVGGWYAEREADVDGAPVPSAIARSLRMLLDPLVLWDDGECLA